MPVSPEANILRENLQQAVLTALVTSNKPNVLLALSGGLDSMVLLHLLAPNYRAVQVTTDLAGFWKNTYPTVKRELSRNYPRHSWPEDPLTAKPPVPKGKR